MTGDVQREDVTATESAEAEYDAWSAGSCSDRYPVEDAAHEHSWRVEGDGEYEPFHNVCEDCGAGDINPLDIEAPSDIGRHLSSDSNKETR